MSGSITGAGSTFQQPAEAAWISNYTGQCSGAKIDYTGTGSGAGIQQFGAGTIDFAGSDVPMKTGEQSTANSRCGGQPAIHIPIAGGGVAVTWNLPGINALKLSPNTIASIFDGTDKHWNSSDIAADNPGVKLPSTPIAVFYRSDSSGTTSVFTSFLAKAATTWKLGSGKTISWPTGQGAKGSPGVTAGVASTVGGVTYTEQAYALQHHLPSASVKNGSGSYVDLTTANVSNALASAKPNPSSAHDLTQKIDFAPTSPTAYPISTVTYVIVCSTYPSSFGAGKVSLIKSYLSYVLGSGQSQLTGLGFAPLPSSLQSSAQQSASAIS